MTWVFVDQEGIVRGYYLAAMKTLPVTFSR
jgi:hypothetical protein